MILSLKIKLDKIGHCKKHGTELYSVLIIL